MKNMITEDNKVRYTICLTKEINYELQVLADDNALSKSAFLSAIIRKAYKEAYGEQPTLYNENCPPPSIL